MSPAELSPPKQPPDEDPVSPKSGSPSRGILTKEALDKLLERFSLDPEEAGRKYLMMQVKVIRYLEWLDSPSPPDQANETINRVARRIEEGVNIINLNGYFREVAYRVYRESLRDPARYAQPIDDVPEIPAEPPADDDQKETRLRCLDECLEKQSAEKRMLILGYYSDVRRGKIDHRRKLADSSTMNALRIRVCRIRKDVEKCVKECVKHSGDSK